MIFEIEVTTVQQEVILEEIKVLSEDIPKWDFIED
jgi:hypothetical protein